MNRRELIVGGLCGAAIGSAWVAGLGIVLQRKEPTLSVIGKGTSLLALLDTGYARVLIAAGPGDPRLTRNLDALLGVFRPRLDLLIGTESGVAEFTGRTLARHGNPQRFVLDRPTGISRDASSTRATGPATLTVALPKGMTLQIATFVRGAWQNGDTPTQSWIATITGHGQRCAIADTTDVLALHGDRDVGLGIAATVDLIPDWDMLRVNSLALPSDHITLAPDSESLARIVRIFPREPVIVAFRRDGLAIQN